MSPVSRHSSTEPQSFTSSDLPGAIGHEISAAVGLIFQTMVLHNWNINICKAATLFTGYEFVLSKLSKLH